MAMVVGGAYIRAITDREIGRQWLRDATVLPPEGGENVHVPQCLVGVAGPADYELLRPHLKPVELKREVVLFEAGDKIDRVYLPHSGIISLVVELAAGEAIEVAMIGRDSLLGIISALLQNTSCGCYGRVKMRYDRLLH
jgi:CRP-like cAMP-binding protein